MSARCSLMSLTPGVSTMVNRFASSGDGWVISTWWTAAAGFLSDIATLPALGAFAPCPFPSPLGQPFDGDVIGQRRHVDR